MQTLNQFTMPTNIKMPIELCYTTISLIFLMAHAGELSKSIKFLIVLNLVESERQDWSFVSEYMFVSCLPEWFRSSKLCYGRGR